MKSVILSQKWKDHLSNLPESGMGYQVVNMKMKDGSQKVVTVLNGEHVLVSEDLPVENISDINIVPAFVSMNSRRSRVQNTSKVK